VTVKYKELPELLAVQQSSDEDLKQQIRNIYGNDLFLFASKVTTEDPEDLENPWKAYPLEDLPYLKDILKSFLEDKLVVVLKSRRMLVTWTYCIAALWDIMFHNGRQIAFVSIKGEKTKSILKRVEFIWDKLPSWKPNVKFVYFPQPKAICEDTHSSIHSYPGGANQLRGEGYSFIFSDELAFQSDQDETWRSSKPTIEGGGRFVAVSTPNGKDNLFYQLCQNPDFKKIELHYSKNPNKKEEWKKKAFSGLTQKDVEQEYELNFVATNENSIYGDFNYQIHIRKQVFNPEKHLLVGWDFGYNRPAVVLSQFYDGIFRVLASKLGYKTTLDKFIEEAILLEKQYAKDAVVIHDFCDIAGKQPNKQTGMTDIQVLDKVLFKKGRFLRYRKTHDLEDDHNIIRNLMTKLQKGDACFQVDPVNTIIIEGLRGGYHYHGLNEKICGCTQRNEFQEKEDEYYKHLLDCIRYTIVNMIGAGGPLKILKTNALPNIPISHDKRFSKKTTLKDIMSY